MINIYPTEIAICFLSSNFEDTIPQQTEILPLESSFIIEKWFRSKKNKGLYNSFSQLINDSINETNSEFMIFCNPKTILSAEDILLIIEKLSTGFCFVSLVNFGLFGATKELFRRIGLMDENFLFGEFEDNDFALRLNQFNKAVWWEYDSTKYKKIISEYTNLRGISSSYFDLKYRFNNKTNTYYVCKKYLNYKKIDDKHSKLRNDIFKTWLDKKFSHSNCFFGDLVLQPVVIVDDLLEMTKTIDFSCEIKYVDGKFMIEILTSDYSFPTHFVVLKEYNKGRKFLFSEKVWSNNFYVINNLTDWEYDNTNYSEEIEVRLFIQNNQIYTNTLTPNTNIKQNFRLPIKIRI